MQKATGEDSDAAVKAGSLARQASEGEQQPPSLAAQAAAAGAYPSSGLNSGTCKSSLHNKCDVDI